MKIHRAALSLNSVAITDELCKLLEGELNNLDILLMDNEDFSISFSVPSEKTDIFATIVTMHIQKLAADLYIQYIDQNASLRCGIYSGTLTYRKTPDARIIFAFNYKHGAIPQIDRAPSI